MLSKSDQVRYFDHQEQFDAAVATEIIAQLKENVAKKGSFNLGLSGGNTPVRIFKELTRLSSEEGISWNEVNLFWIDERCVGPDHEDSNYGSAYEHFISHLDMGNVYRMKGEIAPREAANQYEEKLHQHLPLNEQGVPTMDLALIGMGEDGHVASIFPNAEVLQEKDVEGLYVEHLDAYRITLTYRVLNAIRSRLFIIKGAKKIELLEGLKDLNENKYPVQGLLPSLSDNSWYILNN